MFNNNSTGSIGNLLVVDLKLVSFSNSISGVSEISNSARYILNLRSSNWCAVQVEAF